MKSLLDQLKHWCKFKPDATLAIDGDVTLTYGDALNRALRFAGGMRRLGLERRDRVAPILFNGYRWYDLYYGMSAGGWVTVPLNYRLAGPEIAYQINDSGARVVVMGPEFEELIAGIRGDIPGVEHFIYTGEKAPFDGAIAYDALLDAPPWETEVSEDDLFGIYYTGGTTGLAKGVMLSHRNIIANAYNLVAASRIGADQVGLHAAPMFHLADGAINFGITLAGGSHVLVKAFEPIAVFQAIETYKATFPLWVPTMINVLANHPDVGKYDLSSLNIIAYGASPISPTLLRQAYEQFRCDFMQLYGMTEGGPILTILPPEDHRYALNNPEGEYLLKAAGRQILGVEVRVVDEAGKDVKTGDVGEIIARGHNIMQGYWNKPEETQKALIDGWYWSKDLARIDADHYVYVVDRAKDMIISGGENVYSVEVEDAIAKHPAVLEVAVIGVPDERWGERVKAAVVLKPGAAATETELRDFCKQHIAGYKVPKSVDFLDELPKSGAGKILKKDLRAVYWENSERSVG